MEAEINLNRFLKTYDVHVLFAHVLFQLGAPTHVAKATDIPEQRSHLNDTVA